MEIATQNNWLVLTQTILFEKQYGGNIKTCLLVGERCSLLFVRGKKSISDVIGDRLLRGRVASGALSLLQFCAADKRREYVVALSNHRFCFSEGCLLKDLEDFQESYADFTSLNELLEAKHFLPNEDRWAINSIAKGSHDFSRGAKEDLLRRQEKVNLRFFLLTSIVGSVATVSTPAVTALDHHLDISDRFKLIFGWIPVGLAIICCLSWAAKVGAWVICFFSRN
ncbi:hypothetical protein NCAS_0I02600 [Naumovozyma castellii]|uniref:Uncharacterized protein n=1 Tax=Naumovozyma castellii TaxID=27288 RepID=G0VK94_NAUCA|nr:hypothetical protein NCAS_0I02600 [Naumovozyma castellii CBS 4309]CCC71928.1 hypothetical protein NCAS_0I02600 [Naumovozyma castellii CBS 4309]